jgi:hypothetical protein
MEGVQCVHTIVLTDHDNDALTHGNKLGMRHIEFAPIGCMEDKGLEAVADFVLYPLNIHDSN